MGINIEDYKIKSNHQYSWSYIYSINGKYHELWDESKEKLKKKVLANNLPWDDEKVPKAKSFSKTFYKSNQQVESDYEDPIVKWWCKSNYK